MRIINSIFIFRQPLRWLVGIAGLGVLASCATTPKTSARLDPKTDAAISALSEKLSAVKTLKVQARRTSTLGYFLDDQVAERAKISASVRRPDKFAARLDTNRGKRTVIYDGRQLLLVDHKAQTHAITDAPSTSDKALHAWSDIYGYTPPLAELLVNDLKAYLLSGVSKGSYAGQETIDGEPAERFSFQQEGLAWDLWISTRSGLPKRIETARPNGEGGPPLKQNVIIERWELNAAVNAADFVVSPPKDSLSIELIPLKP